MHKKHDQLSKRIAREIFDPYAVVQMEMAVSSLDEQHMDLWAEPKLPLPKELPGYLVLLVRMLERPGHFELWSSIPDGQDMRETQRKQLGLHHHRCMQAQREGKPTPELFPSWTVTPGKPRSYFERARVQKAQGWPRGFYLTDEHTELRFVVLSELERTRETLLLRLLCPGRGREEARQEIREIAEEDPDKGRLVEMVDLLQRAVARDKNVSEEDRRAFMTEARAEQLRVMEECERRGELRGEQRGEQRGELRGEQRGERKGMVEILLRLYEQRLGPAPGTVRNALLGHKAERLSELVALFATGSADEIARALLS